VPTIFPKYRHTPIFDPVELSARNGPTLSA
jgi:hypothetical protein